jgi:hypothetical protein
MHPTQRGLVYNVGRNNIVFRMFQPRLYHCCNSGVLDENLIIRVSMEYARIGQRSCNLQCRRQF